MDANSLLPKPHHHRSPFTILIAVLGLAGIPAIVLPFELNTSPWRAMTTYDMWDVASPALLAAVVSAASWRWIAAGRLSPPERFLTRAAAIFFGCAFLSIYATAPRPSNEKDWVAFALPLLVLAAGATLGIRNRTRVLPDLNAITAVEIVYVAAVALWLPGYLEGSGPLGRYLVLLTAVVYAAQILAVTFARTDRRSKFVVSIG